MAKNDYQLIQEYMNSEYKDILYNALVFLNYEIIIGLSATRSNVYGIKPLPSPDLMDKIIKFYKKEDITHIEDLTEEEQIFFKMRLS